MHDRRLDDRRRPGSDVRPSRRRAVAALFVAVTAGVGVIDLTAAPTATAAFTCDAAVSYEVARGDSWWSIAADLEVPVRSLLDGNEAAETDLLVPGDDLCLPDGADTAAVCDAETVRSGDGWIAIALRVGVTSARLVAANGGDIGRVLHPGMELCVPSGGRATAASAAASSPPSASSGSGTGAPYTVRPGDSWYGIAARIGVSVRSLLDTNGASMSDTLLIGRRIVLPEGASAPSAAPRVSLDAAPVQGYCSYADTWGEPRHGGRRHQGVDIFTADRAYVYAVTDGRLTGRRWDGAGTAAGNAWTLTAADGTRFFYAHLHDFNPELGLGSTVEAGEIIGWVGGTGNASAPHLHLEIRPQGGAVVNPTPILREQGACNTGRPYRQPSGWIPD